MAASFRLPQERIADPRRRIVSGLVIAAAGLSPLAPNVGCKIEFTTDQALLLAWSTCGEYEVTSAIAYAEIDFLGVGGVGAQTTTTGGGWIGGGFGLEGMAAGVLFATAMNLLTTRTHTTIETLLHLKAPGGRELVLLHESMPPTLLQVVLSPIFELIGAAQIQDTTAAHAVLPANTGVEAAPEDPVRRLERLGPERIGVDVRLSSGRGGR